MTQSELETEENIQPSISKAVLSAAYTKSLFQFFRLGELHDPSNAVFDNTLNEMTRVIDSLMKSSGNLGIQLSVRGEVIFLNGKSIRPKARQFHIYRYLTHFFRERKLGGFKILAQVSFDHLRLFLWSLVRLHGEASIAELKKSMQENNLQEFEIEEIRTYAKESESDSTSDIELIVAALYNRLIKFVEVCIDNREKAAQFELFTADSSIQELALVADEDIISMLRIVSIKYHERPLAYQAVNACFLVVAWAKALRLPLSVVTELGGAALAHPLSILAEKEKLPGESREASISRLTEQVKEVWSLTELQKLSLFEWMKEHGPDGVYKVGESTRCYAHFFSRMVRIAALFEAMTTHRPNQKASARTFLPDEALSELMKTKGLCDPTLLKLFVNWIGVYPIGTLVELQSGEIAQVFAAGSDPTRFQRPIVSVIKDYQGQLLDTPQILDLSDVNDKLGVYKKSIKRSLRFEDVKIPEEYFQISPLRV